MGAAGPMFHPDSMKENGMKPQTTRALEKQKSSSQKNSKSSNKDVDQKNQTKQE